MQSESTLSRKSTLHAAVTAIILFVLSAGLVQAASAQKTSETPPEVVSGIAKLVQPMDSTTMLRVVLGIERPHAAEEEQFLADLHTKGTKEYRHFLKPEEWNARFGPSKQNEQAVVDWAKSQGLTVTGRFPHRLIVDLEAPVSVIEKAFDVKINNYQMGTKIHFSNDRDPSITGGAVGLVHSIIGLNDIQVMEPVSGYQELAMPIYSPGPVKGAMASGQADGDRAKYLQAMKAAKNRKLAGLTNNYYDPTDIYSSDAYDFNALYARGHCCNPFGNAGGTPSVTSIAIATAGSESASDFAGFKAQYPYLAYHYFTIPIDGTPTCCSKEGTLDFEWAMAMSNSFGAGTDTASIYIYQGVNNLSSTFTDMYSHMLADGNARTMSVSYGCAEYGACAPSSVMDTQHGIFNSMVGQGWTLIAASGDQGTTADCSSTSVTYPGSDPNMVSAGGTSLNLNGDSTYYSEVSWTGLTATGSCSKNNGGGGGGCSNKFSAPGYQGNSPHCGANSRSVPDISLNANVGQNFFYNGALIASGGTSIVAPELAGFFAQENAYLLYENGVYLGNSCGNGACAPMGNPNWYMYYEALNAPYAGHYPFYDITSGCTSNDITVSKGISPWCAFGGYDLATGWGSFNALQLAWSINTYLAGDFGAPNVTFDGPTTDVWYSTNQYVKWSVTDTSGNGSPANGVAGFSQAWDVDPGDPYSHSTPGHGDSFYGGPQTRNVTGCLALTSGAGCGTGVSQGCHNTYVRSWDNAGWSGLQTYGPVCYDTIAPNTSDTTSPRPNSRGWNNSGVTLTLLPSDPGEPSTGGGVFLSVYSVDNANCTPPSGRFCALYTSPFSITAEGTHSVYFFSEDIAGNFQSQQVGRVNIDTTAPVTRSSFAGTSPVVVTLAASDTLSGVVGTSYKLDGGAVKPYTSPFAVAAVGNHTVVFQSTDAAGNVEANHSASFKVVGKSTTAVVSSLNPSVYKQAVTFTASLTPATVAGTVTFKNNGVVLGAATVVGGKAKFTTSALGAGSHTIVAIFSGNANYSGSTSPAITQTVKKAATTTKLVSSLNPSKKGQAVTFTATVAPGTVAAGSVVFKNGSTVFGTAPLNPTTHKAAITRSTLSVGTHSITAVFGGTTNFNPSTSGVVKQVVQ